MSPRGDVTMLNALKSARVIVEVRISFTLLIIYKIVKYGTLSRHCNIPDPHYHYIFLHFADSAGFYQ